MYMYPAQFQQIQRTRDRIGRYVWDVTPASTLVQVVHLARPELMLEIEVIAAVPERPRVLPASR
jgi:enamine deaminase RidA (YjgF/YER057c/UK114 family)